MSRSGYGEDCDNHWDFVRWRGAVKSALRGARGQAFLREMLASMDALPEKRLIADVLEANGSVCAIGSVGLMRGYDMANIDPEESDDVAAMFGISPAMAREIVFENDGESFRESPYHRFERMRSWIIQNIAGDVPSSEIEG